MSMTMTEAAPAANGPPALLSFAHLSIPCRDLEEAKRFYVEVLGGTIRLEQPHFLIVKIADTEIGVGSAGCSFVQGDAEYPHFAFFAAPEAMLGMKAWLERCGIPSSNFWTRRGVEALMFFRDPSGNVIELFCERGFKGAENLPRGPARGHGTAVDIEALRYTEWRRP
jgi:catechol 2,3-dioxygenase-like lactoylglutathione lyase family enzyme